MSDINELQKEVGLLREKVELLRALEELKAREPVKEYTPWPYPVYPYGPHPSPWWGIDLTPKCTWTTGGSTNIDYDIQSPGGQTLSWSGEMGDFTGGE